MARQTVTVDSVEIEWTCPKCHLINTDNYIGPPYDSFDVSRANNTYCDGCNTSTTLEFS